MLGAYNQVAIGEEDKLYTVFENNSKLYQFCRIPFGVQNGVARFQRIMDNIIMRNSLRRTSAYTDNIVVTGKTHNLSTFLELAKLHNLTFNEINVLYIRLFY